MGEKVDVAAIAAAVTHDVYDEATAVLLEEGDFVLKLLDGVGFAAGRKAGNTDEADGLVADGESAAEEFVSRASAEPELEAGRRIEEWEEGVEGRKAAGKDVIGMLSGELAKRTRRGNGGSPGSGGTKVGCGNAGPQVPKIFRQLGVFFHGVEAAVP